MKTADRCAVMTAALLLICSALLLGSVLIWAGPCASMLELCDGRSVHMGCFYLKPVGCCFALIWVALAFDCFKNRRVPVLPVIISGAAVISITFNWAFGIGVCPGPPMSCHTMAYWLRALGAIAAISGIVGTIDLSKQL